MKTNITLKIVNTLAVVLLAGGALFAQSTGYMNPTDTALPHGWTNPLSGMVSDAQWATVTHGAGCNCPWIYLSWNGGANYSPSALVGPYDTVDSWDAAGNPTDLWTHAWVDSEFSNKNFRLKIENPGLTISQGYRDFNFIIPAGATINGIEVNVQEHGNSTFTLFYLNALEVNVFYTIATGIGSITAFSNGVQLYPNPAHDKITLHATGLSQMNYALLSIDGRTIFEKNTEEVNTDFSADINLEGITPGIYILRTTSNEGAEYRKVVVQ